MAKKRGWLSRLLSGEKTPPASLAQKLASSQGEGAKTASQHTPKSPQSSPSPDVIDGVTLGDSRNIFYPNLLYCHRAEDPKYFFLTESPHSGTLDTASAREPVVFRFHSVDTLEHEKSVRTSCVACVNVLGQVDAKIFFATVENVGATLQAIDIETREVVFSREYVRGEKRGEAIFVKNDDVGLRVLWPMSRLDPLQIMPVTQSGFGSVISELDIHDILDHDVSPDGRYVALVGNGWNVILVDILQSQIVTQENLYPDQALSVRFGLGGTYLVVGCRRSVQIWDMKTRNMVSTVKGADGRVVIPSPTFPVVLLAPVSGEQWLVWDWQNNRQLGTVRAPLRSGFFSMDGTHLVLLDQQLHSVIAYPVNYDIRGTKRIQLSEQKQAAKELSAPSRHGQTADILSERYDFRVKRANEYHVGEKVVFAFDTYFPDDFSIDVLRHVNVGTEAIVVGEERSFDVTLEIPGIGKRNVSAWKIESLEDGQGGLFQRLGDWIPCRNDLRGRGWILMTDPAAHHRIRLKDGSVLEGRIGIGPKGIKIEDHWVAKSDIDNIVYRRPSRSERYVVPD